MSLKSEKRTEISLSNELSDWPTEYIFYNPSENNILKEEFSKCSKNGNTGIPDRIYFDGKNLVVFECKSEDTKEKCAFNQLKHYVENLEYNISYNEIYIISFVGISDCKWKIFKVIKNQNEFSYIEKLLNNLSYFNFLFKTMDIDIKTKKLNIMDMEKIIHKLHNRIRDSCKFNDSDKHFFISSIIIAFQYEEFKNLFSTTTTIQTLSSIILSYVSRSLNEPEILSHFEFLETHTDNKFLFEFCKSIYQTIISQNIDDDVLNVFYQEFVSYNNSDSKNLGIVLTPSYIVKLMIKLLNITDKDIVLDLCCGTGSFLCESFKYNPKKVIGCELQSVLYSLAKINMCLRKKNGKIIKGDCFKYKFLCTKSVINPPFGMDDKKELDFIYKQLKSISQQGIAVSIFPIGCISNNKKNQELKKKITDNSKIKCIINTNTTLFYPTAGVQCCIMILEKNENGHDFKTDNVLFINYEDDRTTIKKHVGKVKMDDFDSRFNEIFDIYSNNKVVTGLSLITTIKLEDEWNFHNYNKNQGSDIDMKDIFERYLYDEYMNKIKNLKSKKVVFKNTKSFKIPEVFNIESCKRITLSDAETHTGPYPYITAKGINNGIACYTDRFTHEGNKITFANSGSVASSFYQRDKFCATDSIYVLTLKNKPLSNALGYYFCKLLESLKNKYSFGRACRLNKLKNEEIILPITIDGTIDYKNIEDEFSLYNV